MISVLIAEDELLVRMGIMSMVDWESMGMKVISCVSDGLAALDDARKFRPNLLITDIVMPGMDGISLLSTLRSEGIKPVCIVITALHQRQAMERADELGIVACLVKATMTQRDIMAALVSAAAKTNDNDSAEAADCDYVKLSQAYGNALANSAECDTLPSAAAYVLCKTFASPVLDGVLGKTLMRMTIEAFPGCTPIASVLRDNRILIVYSRSLNKLRGGAVNVLIDLKRYVERNLAVISEFVILDKVPRDTEFKVCLDIMLRELAHMSHIPGVSWLDGEELISALSASQRTSYIDEFMSGIWAMRDPGAIYAAWHALDAFNAAESEHEQKSALIALANAAGAAICDSISAQQQACLDALHKNIPDGSYHTEIGRAVELVLRNLNREVKLSEAAAKAGFHEVYFSSIFKQQLGMGFSRFCSAIRIEHAKQLLSDGTYTTNQVSEMCGYRDMAYFCRVFKQTVGITPAAWRDMH